MPPLGGLLAVLLAVFLLAACGTTGADPAADTTASDPAASDPAADSDPPAYEPPLLRSGPGDGSGNDAIVQGEVTLRGGCLRVDGAPAIWPRATTWRDDDQTLVLPGGEEVALGERVTGSGGYGAAADLGEPLDPDVRAAALACAGADGEVAIFNPDSDVARVD